MVCIDDFKEEDFYFIRGLVYKEAGIVIGERKREMIYRRLSRRARELQLNEVSTYCDVLRNYNNISEITNFINTVTTNLTSFFRESHHFCYLEKDFTSSFLSANKKRLRIWSSACSTGEEPYSIAMSLLTTFGRQLDEFDVKILATDLDTEVIKIARKGLYKESSVKNLSKIMLANWFFKDNNKGRYEVKKDVKKLITFNKLNLLGKWPMKGKFDVIFCRNVLIYFDKKSQIELIKKFYNYLEPNGILVLGHSESVIKESQYFEGLGKTIYQKISL